MNVLIIGNGSIGKRHYKIFKKLNCNVFKISSKLFFKKFKKKRCQIVSNEIFTKYNPDLVAICNATSLHFLTFKKLSKLKKSFFIEKPTVCKQQEIIEINKFKKKSIFNGYMMRYDPRIIELKKKINKNLKSIYSANFIWQTCMPYWHLKENYRKNYANNKKLGGGVLLTCSHEIDLSIFLFGNVKEAYCQSINSSLKNNVENSVVIILKHFNNIVSKINLNFANFHHKSRNITISSKNFDIKWDFYKNYLIQYSKNKVIKIFPKKKFSLDKMYYDQNSEILKKIKKNKINKINTSAESVIMALKKSLNLKKKIFLKN